MAVLNLENIIGVSGGRPNLIVYVGPTLDLDGADSPITAANTLAVDRWNDSGTLQTYVPGAGSNPFTTLEAGYRGVHGRAYVIHAVESFVLENCSPGQEVVEL